MTFWRTWKQQRQERKRDRQERALLMSYAPKPGQDPRSAERHAEAAALEVEHQADRRRRAELATDAGWD